VVIAGLDADHYNRHPLHGEGSAWTEKNCYVDVWIELLHSLRLNPLPMLSPALAADYLSDQWTFFKPAHNDLWDLYGIDVQELTVWRPLLDHAVDHLGAGRLIATEADAIWLPDTTGTDYRHAHTKTTVVLNDLDVQGRTIGYFHNAGYYRLTGDDFDRVFRLESPTAGEDLPLYAEVLGIDRLRRLDESLLAQAALPMLQRSVERLPARNPMPEFAAGTRDRLSLLGQDIDAYHAWAFSNTRQMGLSFEVAGACLRWLEPHSDHSYATAAECCEAISALAKTMVLKGARAVASGKIGSLDGIFQQLAEHRAKLSLQLR
jgi:hypothetical protein